MMLTDFAPLATKFGTNEPYEREYEGWILREIEDYFRELGLRFECMIVSTGAEKQTGLDAFMRLGGKYFGLQFKRPYLVKPRNSNNGLRWEITHPQFSRIEQRPAIFYALPSFVNRDLRRVSLSHVFFWRHNLKDGERLYLTTSQNYLYYFAGADIKKRDLDPSDPLKTAKPTYGYRWGRFSEGLLSCTLGAVDDSAVEQFKATLDEIQGTLVVARLTPISD